MPTKRAFINTKLFYIIKPFFSLNFFMMILGFVGLLLTLLNKNNQQYKYFLLMNVVINKLTY